MILIPNSDCASAVSFISDGSAAALRAVANPDGSFTNLISSPIALFCALGSDRSRTAQDDVMIRTYENDRKKVMS